MPLGRKHLRRSRDAPTGGFGHTQRAVSRLWWKPSEVNRLDAHGNSKGSTLVFYLRPCTSARMAVFPFLLGSRDGNSPPSSVLLVPPIRHCNAHTPDPVRPLHA